MGGNQLWAKDLPLDVALHRFTVGDDPITDLALLPWDAVGSAAHARTLAKGGWLSQQDASALVTALHALHQEALDGTLVIRPEQEDCHTALEAELTARCAEAGKRIHLGRSRNDQVIVAFRLLLRQELMGLGQQVAETAAAFLDLGTRYREVSLPGYTHLRRAMPSSWALWGASFAEGLVEELEALQGLLGRLDRCPAGAAAGFGASLPLDRAYTAQLLGFSSVQRSPLDVINSRGRHEAALGHWAASVGLVLEKALWDLALYSLEGTGFIRLPDAFTTGSSIMPQKRNPDVVELGRSTCRLLRGQANLVLELAGGLPSSYHRDVQLLKAPTLGLLRTASGLLSVLPTLLRGIVVNEERCAAACSDELYAAHAASARAAAGEPFRDAYRAVAQQVLDGSFHPDRALLGGAIQPDLDSPRRALGELSAKLSADFARWDDALSSLWTAPICVPTDSGEKR